MKQGIRCSIKKGTTYSHNYGSYETEKDYYTFIPLSAFNSRRELVVKAKRNIKKQIAETIRKPYDWMYIDFDYQDINFECVGE